MSRKPASKGVDLPAGAYFVTARLPVGEELSRSLFITAPGITPPTGWDGPDVEKGDTGGTKTIVLTPMQGQDSPQESWETSQFLGAWSSNLPHSVRLGSSSLWQAPIQSGSGLESLGPATPIVPMPDVGLNCVRWFWGNVLDVGPGVLRPRTDLPGVLRPGQPLMVDWGRHDPFQPLIMQLLRPEMKPLNVVLPVSPKAPCYVALQKIDDGQSSLDIRLAHATADLFLRYIQCSHTEQAEVTSEALQAEDLLRDKMDDPIAAAIGAYSLLRFRRLDKVRDWAANLASGFTWLPDGLAILGEGEARSGNHERAITLFNQILGRGLPIFGVGLSYAIDRLRLYRDTLNSSQPTRLDPKALAIAENVLARLQEFATFAVFQSAVMTYTGLDPTKPDDTPSGKDIWAVCP